MGFLKKALFIVSFILVAVVLIGFLLPSEYEVKRSIVIEAEPEAIYSEVVNLRAWQNWGVWFQNDPDMQIEYGGPDRAIGMYSKWQSETQGDGEMEITELQHNREIVYRLYFPEFDMGSTGAVKLQPTPEGTRVTWSDTGTVGNNPMNRYFVLFLDDMIGPDFEMGLENLKTVVENKT
ncbi:SRPBCC family protein [Salinimonas marina]|uniref:SRPBCC family protein n=1 Tax=Salinimonas marina TaxID=2785918 RepID=A0A7S9DWI8_9ALTE|nr:SRPBCC family protein [Salinimonas marina]QPG04525.1 SRPBCC family protein [Salinimonas marina]